MKRSVLALGRVAAALGILTAPTCRTSTNGLNDEPVRGAPPQQYHLVSGPAITRHSVPDSAFLVFTVITADSTAHRNWTPTALHVESDQGFSRDILLVPFTCIEPSPASDVFPFNFQWLSCNKVLIETSTPLAESQITEIEALVTGRLIWTYGGQTSSATFYVFEVPSGRDAVTEARRRTERLPFVTSASLISQEPACVHSDQVPPPSCPPWYLFRELPYRLGSASGDTITTRSGGWVRARYIDAAGFEHATDYITP